MKREICFKHILFETWLLHYPLPNAQIKQFVSPLLKEWRSLRKSIFKLTAQTTKNLLKHTWNFAFFLGMLSKTRICSKMFRTLGLIFGFFTTSWIFWMKKTRMKSAKQRNDQMMRARYASWKYIWQKSHTDCTACWNHSISMKKTTNL